MLQNLNSRFLTYICFKRAKLIYFFHSFILAPHMLEYESWTVQEERIINVTSTQGIPWLPRH